MKSINRRGAKIAAAASITGLTGLALFAGGCGGASRSNILSSVGSGGGGDVISSGRATGVASLTIPARPSGKAASTRLIPHQTQYLKVEFLDDDGTGKLVAIPSYDSNGVAFPIGTTGHVATSTPFDVITLSTAAPTTRLYSYLPLKNLTLRVTAYASDPTSTSDSVNVPLATATVPFRPQQAGLSGSQTPGTNAANVTITLESAIASLVINGPDTLTNGDVANGDIATGQYTATAYSAAGYVILTNPKLTWDFGAKYVSGTGIDTKVTSATSPDAVGKVMDRITYTGLRTDALSLTVTDNEDSTTSFTATKTIAVKAASASALVFLNTASSVPPGTRSLLIQVDDFGPFTSLDNATLNQDSTPKPVQVIKNVASSDDVTKTIDFYANSAPITPGTRWVWVRCYAGPNATGAMLGDAAVQDDFSPGTYQSGKGKAVTIGDGSSTYSTFKTFATTGSWTVKALSGSYYTGPVNGAYTLTSLLTPTDVTQQGNFQFLGGSTNDVLSVYVNVPSNGTYLITSDNPTPVALPSNLFTINILKNGSNGSVGAAINQLGATTYSVTIPSVSADDTAGSLTLQDKNLTTTTPLKTGTIGIQANQGANATLSIN